MLEPPSATGDSSRQMRCFPIHGHADTRAAAGMIEKVEFLERRRIEFAVSTEFERHLCHAIGLARSVDSESICFAFCDAYDRIEKRRGDENQRDKDQYEQGKPSRIRNPANAPSASPASRCCVEQRT